MRTPLPQAPPAPDLLTNRRRSVKICGQCEHTIRPGEQYEPREFMSNSGPFLPGYAHTPVCPTSLPMTMVPCDPCLHHQLLDAVDQPHACHGRAFLALDRGQLIVAPQRRRKCPCPCTKGGRQ